MKVRLEHGGSVFEFERKPMQKSRFRALCSLVLAAIVGGVFLGTVALVGVWAIVWAVGALTLYGLYQMFKGLCR